MEQRWFYNRNKELADKRQDEEMISMMQEWSQAKGRMEREISRKVESSI